MARVVLTFEDVGDQLFVRSEFDPVVEDVHAATLAQRAAADVLDYVTRRMAQSGRECEAIDMDDLDRLSTVADPRGTP